MNPQDLRGRLATTLDPDPVPEPGPRDLLAAVLIPIVEGTEPSVVFTRRTDHLSRHAGEISFPGGLRHAEDATLEDTAVRETEEELGLARASVDVLGALPPEELDACADHVRGLLAERAPAEPRPTRAVGVAGTVTTLAVLSLGLPEEDPALLHGHRMTSALIQAEVERLAALRVSEIRGLRGMHPDRAPVIIAGALVVAETLRFFRLDDVEVSEHDLMHGAALAAAELPERHEGAAPPGAYTCC